MSILSNNQCSVALVYDPITPSSSNIINFMTILTKIRILHETRKKKNKEFQIYKHYKQIHQNVENAVIRRIIPGVRTVRITVNSVKHNNCLFQC